MIQSIRFQGQYHDDESGLYYNRYRYYDSDTARYLSQDPIGLDGGDNLTQYAPNPVAWVDPLGLRKRTGCPGKFHSFNDYDVLQDKFFASDAVQFRMANKALIERMNSDPAFRRDILSRNPALLAWSKNPKDLGSSPPGMTWHHNDQVGRLNLVDRSDHGDNHGIYHPDGTGGRDKWGGGKPGRKGKLNPETGCLL